MMLPAHCLIPLGASWWQLICQCCWKDWLAIAGYSECRDTKALANLSCSYARRVRRDSLGSLMIGIFSYHWSNQ